MCLGPLCEFWSLEKTRKSIEQREESMTLKGTEASGSFKHFSPEKALLFISFFISLEMPLVFCLKFHSFINSKMSPLAVTFTFLSFCLYQHYIWSIVEYCIISPLTYLSNICHYLLFPTSTVCIYYLSSLIRASCLFSFFNYL